MSEKISGASVKFSQLTPNQERNSMPPTQRHSHQFLEKLPHWVNE
jgi:hypothetical protein